MSFTVPTSPIMETRRVFPVGFLLVLISSFFSWTWTPLGEFQESFPVNGIALFIGCVSLFGWILQSGSFVSISGVLGLGLFSFSLLHLAFQDSTFWTLIDQNTQYMNMISFSNQFISINRGAEPGLQDTFVIEPFLDPLSTASHFIMWSGWLCLFGSVLLICEGFRMKNRPVLIWTGGVAWVCFLVLGIMLFEGLTAQYYWARGRHKTAIGQYAQAIQKYRIAQKWSPLIAKNEQFHIDLGAAYDRLGRSAHPHVRFYRGDRYAQQDRFEEALFEYNLAENNSKSSSELKEIVRKQIAQTLIKKGLAHYQDGNSNQAIEVWERAWTFDHNQIQAAYFVAWGYFQEGRYEQSIAMNQYLLSQSTNRLLNATIHTNIGDGYWKLNDPVNARKAYQASKAINANGNFRVFENLGGGIWGM